MDSNDPKLKFYGHPKFYEIIEQLKDLHSRKNQDYAGKKDPLANFRMCKMMDIPAWHGVVIRLTDKISRLMSFCANEGLLAVKDESIEDTFRDTAVYAILGLILFDEEKIVPKDLGSLFVNDIPFPLTDGG